TARPARFVCMKNHFSSGDTSVGSTRAPRLRLPLIWLLVLGCCLIRSELAMTRNVDIEVLLSMVSGISCVIYDSARKQTNSAFCGQRCVSIVTQITPWQISSTATFHQRRWVGVGAPADVRPCTVDLGDGPRGRQSS